MSYAKVPEIFSSGIIKIELIGGGCVRYTLGANCVRGRRPMAKTVAYIIAPISIITQTIEQLEAVKRNARSEGLCLTELLH